MPFWFWNDDLEEGELLRQLHAFHQVNFGGFVLHARVGLSRRIGYLTDEFFSLVRRVVAEAAQLDMKVILYDEGSYPSGSAQGAVVAQNADYASQAMGLWEREIEGPYSGFWRPNTGRNLLDRHLCTLAGRIAGGQIDPQTVRLLKSLPNDIFKIALPAGSWNVMSIWNVAGGGHIRGVFPEEDAGTATAPPAGDILNPDAVACFIRLTHDRYYEHLKDYFGTTIIAMFTDEPSILGGSPGRISHPMPYTPGLISWLENRWGEDPRPWLPALWLDYGKGTEEFRHKFNAAIQDRLGAVFFTAQSRWCADHGIALTGHPAQSNELSPLRHFQLPGQDMVWRYVEPDKPTALEGRHSIAAKAATSAARMQGARRILTEVCGAYGWRLTLEEMKWLFDWHLVRGNNLIDPHAVYYSIRGRRAWESEPDLYLHNTWRKYVGSINRYAQRLSWLLCDGFQVCDVAILGDGNALPWEGSKQLYQNQIDFLYLDDQSVAEAKVGNAVLETGTQSFRAVVIEGNPTLSEPAKRILKLFAEAGGHVIDFQAGMDLPSRLDDCFERDLSVEPSHPDLRFIHYEKSGLDFYFLCNEGPSTIQGRVFLSLVGQIECWDPMTGLPRRVETHSKEGRIEIVLDLPRRESVVFAVDRETAFFSNPNVSWKEEQLPLNLEWKVHRSNGEPVSGLALGDWAQKAGLELFSGTLNYRTDLEIPGGDGELELDLGQVGDIAEVFLNGKTQGVRMWSPYRVCIGNSLPPGRNELEVQVTNSMANAYEGAQCPSGLLGPVQLVRKSVSDNSR